MSGPATRAPRVFLGVAEISGWYARLTEGLLAQGVPATLVTLDAHPFAYDDGPPAHWTVEPIRRCRSRAVNGGRLRQAWRVPEMALRTLLLVWAIPRFDVFVFGFRTSLLKLADLPVLRLFRRRVILVFHGSDERPPYIDGFIDDGQSGEALAAATRRQAARIRWIERWADVCVSNPLSAQFHQQPVVLLQAVGQPVPVPDVVVPAGDADGSDPAHPVRVVHAPSNPVAKGTDEVRRVMEALGKEGLAVTYVELTGRTNAEVLEELDRADLAVDQRWSDISLSIFAAEAAAHGRPPVVGGYGHDELAKILDPIEMAPAAYAHPDDLLSAVRALVCDPAHRLALGAIARRMVAAEWSSEAVARKFRRIIDDDIPPEWLWHPASLEYVHGAGLSEERLRRQTRDVIAVAGVAGLHLDDKPVLRARLLDLVDRDE